ncbi:Glycogen Synthase Kinase-3 Alpha [Manis pentadactyla]|nr:Glycogen Synthase Kinase-3 Alpha [Manis pentadactyla]
MSRGPPPHPHLRERLRESTDSWLLKRAQAVAVALADELACSDISMGQQAEGNRGQGEVTFEVALKEDTGSMYLLIAQPLHIPETSELISFTQKR